MTQRSVAPLTSERRIIRGFVRRTRSSLQFSHPQGTPSLSVTEIDYTIKQFITWDDAGTHTLCLRDNWTSKIASFDVTVVARACSIPISLTAYKSRRQGTRIKDGFEILTLFCHGEVEWPWRRWLPGHSANSPLQSKLCAVCHEDRTHIVPHETCFYLVKLENTLSYQKTLL